MAPTSAVLTFLAVVGFGGGFGEARGPCSQPLGMLGAV